MTKFLVSTGFLAALAVMLPAIAQPALVPDFTLGPGGKATISVDTDSTMAGCSNSDTSECDGYSMKIPITFNPSGDGGDDLMGGSQEFVAVFIGAGGQLCSMKSSAVFESSFPESSLKVTKNKNAESAKFSGSAQAVGLDGMLMVPMSLKIKLSRKNGAGSLSVKGLAQSLGTLNGATVDVDLQVQEASGDGDIDESCATVPVKFKSTK